MAAVLSLYQQHVRRWSGCKECPLHEHRKQVVLARGSVPCEVLLIGEAPGMSEDVLGRPFCGPAGLLLDQIVERARAGEHGPKWTFGVTNLVACVPLDETGAKTEEPDDDCVRACAPRLAEFVKIADPHLIVTVGSLARDWLDEDYRHHVRLHRKIPRAHITHPAAILRMNIAQRGLEAQRCVVKIVNAVEELGDEKTLSG